MKTPNLVSLVILVNALACILGAAAAARQDPALAVLAARSRALSAAVERRDAGGIADLFTADASISVPGSPGVVSGRRDIAGFWRAALDGGLRGLALTADDLIGEGDLRVETGRYAAFGPDHRELGHGRYLLVWMRQQGEWRIGRDFAHADAATTAPVVPGQAALPSDYRQRFHVLGATLVDDQHGLTTVYGNDLVASAAATTQSRYPDDSVIVMEFAEPLRDGEGQLIRDAHGQPVRGAIAHVDVMRRVRGFGAVYGDSRAGEWEFASYRADGSVLIAPENAAPCAACHLKAGTEKDFVFRTRSWQ